MNLLYTEERPFALAFLAHLHILHPFLRHFRPLSLSLALSLSVSAAVPFHRLYLSLLVNLFAAGGKREQLSQELRMPSLLL